MKAVGAGDKEEPEPAIQQTAGLYRPHLHILMSPAFRVRRLH